MDTETQSPQVRPTHRNVREIENIWIPMPDGCRLAARIWLPEDAESSPVPAILEYIPYRKRDHTAQRDEGFHPRMAAEGYACVRVDMRGNGDSEGLMYDEYLLQEQDDGVAVIDWLAAQPWCDGKVGMIGISWGGFNGLQIAARRPRALAAVITICSTDDRYADDIHYKGGCLLNDNLAWGATMLALSSRPPDPALVGERWRPLWLERLENMPFLAAEWLQHQHRDAYWRHGSVCEDFSAIGAAVLAVGGWADPYSNAVPRLLAGLAAPAKGLVGPWGHKYPHIGVPGPAIDFHQEMRRWWDRWLKGADNGLERESAYRAYMQSAAEIPGADVQPGRWVAEAAWPSGRVASRVWFLSPDGRMTRDPSAPGNLLVASPNTVGLSGGRFCPKLARPDLPGDQREDDAGSVTFTTAPLAEPLEILGAAEAELEISVDRPQAFLALRLCDVAPDGTSLRVTYGLLNLTHRDGHARPQALQPGRRYRVRVKLDDVAYAFAPGRRVRLAVSTAYWPMVWPSPEPASVQLHLEGCRLLLPERPPDPGDAAVHFAAPAAPVEDDIEMLVPPEIIRRTERNAVTGETVVTLLDDSGLKRIRGHGLEHRLIARERYSIRPDDPLSALAETHWTTEVGRGTWRVRTESRTSMQADREAFHLKAELTAWEGDQEAFRREWRRRIPRALV